MNHYLERGNKLWEGSRMFLPEHKKALSERRKNQQKAIKPILDEQKLEELNQCICYAKNNNLPVCVVYFQNGTLHKANGYIDAFYEISKELRITGNSIKSLTLKVADILEVQL
ncbi:YolD-like family protein [Scopulibacillus cellulosilyticus]|uniref:YolD-like family protein n=1 Tax=Scopulibacillus cellulosilyticus TaxID=2665665 RepID=A0ABW2PZE0_9BACL